MIKNVHIITVDEIGISKKKIHTIVKHLRDELDLTITSLLINFVRAETITEINEKYLDHRGSTDIITFNYGADNRIIDAEIFISIPDAIDNAGRYSVSNAVEFLRLVIHGMLHLAGYDDMEPEKKAIMKNKEDYLVRKFEYIIK